MKILYIANEIRDVQVAARALRGIAPNVTVLWASSAERVAFWIRESLAALIVEIQVDSQGCLFLEHVRRLGMKAPVVVVLPEGTGPPLESLKAGADDYVAKSHSLYRELPVVVTRTIERAQTLSTGPWEHLYSETVAESATPEFADRQAHFTHVLEPVDEQSREQTREVELTRQDEASAIAEVDRLTRREGELTSMLTEAAATRNTLERRVADIETALVTANERLSHERLVALELVADRQTEFQAQLEQEAEKRRSVEAHLADAETARDGAEKRHTLAVTAAAAFLAERQAHFEAELAEAATTRSALGQQAHDLEAALDGTQQTLASHAAEIERLTRREAELASMLAEADTARSALGQQAHDLEAALDGTQQTLASHAAEIERLTRREDELTSMLAEAAAIRNTLEYRLAKTETAFRDADERATQDRLEAAKTAAVIEAELDGLIRQERATCALVEQKLANVEAARRETEHQLAHVEAARRDAEQQLAHVEAAWRDAEQHASAMTIAATALAERQAQFETELSQTAATRDDLRQRLSDVEALLERARHDHEGRLAELVDEIRTLEAERGALQESLASIHERSRRLEIDHREERDGLERGRLAAEAEVRRLAAEHTEAQHSLVEARGDFQHTLDLISGEYTGALAKLVASVTERDARIEEQRAQHSAALRAMETDRSQLQDGFQTAIAARDREIEQLQGTLKAAALELVGVRTRCEALQTEADRVLQVQKQLEDSRVETRRQFQRTPLALCRCTRDGALLHANRAFADLVGYRKPDELRGADFAKTVFEAPDDLFWLIERCLSTRGRESIETAWKRMNGERVLVRLWGSESTPDLIEIAVEDITNLRALEDRLRQAHRMEAVGRLASEIAVTCGNLLRNVHQDGQQWLTTVNDNVAFRQRGERLLDEVTRAASFLQQLAAYSDEQTSALGPVDLYRVLRDLKPILKQVAGDDVELELPKISSPLNVDVKAERVERLLVNLASYGRQRMPFGGRLKFELATVVVDQKFIAQHPNVRQGPHALITVTEVKRDMPAEGSLQLRSRATDASAGGVASGKPGVDLGALQELIGESGGHLWIAIEPPGHMVVKIHLPLRTWDDQGHPRTPDTRTRLGRAAARWFRR